ncbi:MAG TPA: hypothetical protein PKC28_00215 [Bdellovibrionales bacterium]|nr:hypothetical protein [Bdellovibrionales bacterium]
MKTTLLILSLVQLVTWAHAEEQAAPQPEVTEMSKTIRARLDAETGGDEQKLGELMVQARQNPTAFFEKYFTAEEKAKVDAMALELDKKKAAQK